MEEILHLLTRAEKTDANEVSSIDISPILNFFYEKVSIRVRNRFEEKHQSTSITATEIYPPDAKLISRIMNNRQTKNNQYLVTDRALLHNHPVYGLCGIVAKLDFESTHEVLWGSKSEREAYIPDLFDLLWRTIVESNPKHWKIANRALLDYVPYAKDTTYYHELFESGQRFPAFFYGVSEDNILNTIQASYIGAYKHLYKNCFGVFRTDFENFAMETDSFHMIKKVFNNFIYTKFIPMLEHFEAKEDSLGLRVKSLILSDLAKVPYLITDQYQDDTYCQYLKQLISASSNYVLELERIQSTFVT